MLELEPNVPNMGFIYPVLLWDEKEVVLIDAGLPGQTQSIMELIKKEGLQPEKLTKIIITHQDMDHIGSLAQIVNTVNNDRPEESKIHVYSHELEKPYIQAERMPIKFTKEMLEKKRQELAQLTPEQRKEYDEMFSSNKPKVTDTLNHGQVLPCCGDLKIIHTAGHTPGHISIYLEKYKTLIAGDALNAGDGKLAGPNPVHTYDMVQARKSLETLLDYDIERVVCYHGGLVSGEIGNQIRLFI
ncbi:MBL fold metallo-hydrolase [Ruminiclostridium cellobioparum]|uniref:Beta-lactamase domain-containing protein n=1 Tax=Ruminiclostridium cellobioparum subsp. termitidis CT1112 TaxID=1195236 RepID=S0FPF2_RUMCE|nr:MBL fold metallo-hydrolase [Ruminiclostridium cellobioparum]EMS73762.1 beta-lactamase domain-containing protein [Ruminiclostridium cellobioparum subsp. termitidis CT1112]